MRKAVLPRVAEWTRKVFKKIAKSCKLCQIYAAGPRRFKLILRNDAQFIFTFYVNLFWIEKKTVLHVVKEGTRYQDPRYVHSFSVEKFLKKPRFCCIDVYSETWDVIDHDVGK